MLGFWKTSDGNARSSVKGLSFEQLEWLKSLKEGERLVLWLNSPKNSNSSPDIMLGKTGTANPQDKA